LQIMRKLTPVELSNIFLLHYELSDRSVIYYDVKALFMNEQFSEFDALSKRYRSSEERTGSGIWKLSIFYFGIEQITTTNFTDEHYWAVIEYKVNKWIKSNPTSPTAHFVKGIILKGYALKIRGSSFEDEVPKEAWKPFKEHLTIAKNHMVDSKSIASIDPHCYVVKW